MTPDRTTAYTGMPLNPAPKQPGFGLRDVFHKAAQP